MVAHRQIAKRLAADKNTATGHNMDLKETEDGQKYIEGYGWAIYAVRQDDTIVVYNGWYGYSVTTSKHLNMIKQAARSSDVNLVISDEDPKYTVPDRGHVRDHIEKAR